MSVAGKLELLKSVEVGAETKPGETRVRRLALSKDGLVTQPAEGVHTVCDILDYAARKFSSKNAMGVRDVLNVITEEKEVKRSVEGKEVVEKKKWEYYELGPFHYISFTQLKQYSEAVGRGLVDLGLSKGDIINIYAATSVNWQLMAFACASVSVTIATAYDTLGEPGLTHSLNEGECIGIFTNADLFPVLYKVLPNAPKIKFIIYDGTPDSAVLDKIKAVRETVTVLPLDVLRARGEAITISPDEAKARLPKPDDVQLIMYTSGSTGTPKGVTITHANVVSAVGSVYKLLDHLLRPGDAFLAFLPLAHILEFCVEACLLFAGLTIGYGKVKTLADQSVRNCRGDIQEFKPTIMIGVPAVWETIRKGILAQVNSGGMVKKMIFNASLRIKKAGIPVLSQVADSVVFSRIKSATGGRLRIGFSGGAPMNKDTHEFLNLVLVQMMQGYGMTEACAMTTILPTDVMSLGNVGLPVPCSEIKLVDVPEAGYFSTNDPPQGEVCVRGPSVISGYFKRPDLNSDPNIFAPDGWFKTGDIGQWNPNGTLSIIDRIKNLIKLQGGEYIALELLETTFKSCTLVQNLCVHGHPDARQPMAVIIPHEVQLRQQLRSQPIGVDPDASLESLCEDDRVRNLILTTCNAIGKKAGFKSLELLEAVVLTAHEWTPESGLVTAAQKLQRNKITEAFRTQIKKVYPY